jgi:hypothetical protein
LCGATGQVEKLHPRSHPAPPLRLLLLLPLLLLLLRPHQFASHLKQQHQLRLQQPCHMVLL